MSGPGRNQDDSTNTTMDVALRQAELVGRARIKLLNSGTDVTVDEVASTTGKLPPSVRKWLARHRDAGRLIFVVHDRVDLVPSFQLDEAFDLEPRAADVVARLTSAGLSNWAIWRWATNPNGWLLDRTPAEELADGKHQAVMGAVNGQLQTETD